MQDWLTQLITFHPYLVYGIVIALASIEGPILSILFGIFVHAGLAGFLPAYGALIVGDVLGDTVWYYVGYYAGHPFVRRFGKYVGITKEKIITVTDIFHRHHDKILIISKVTNGFGFSLVTLLTAGIVKIPFGRYLFFNTLGQFVWTGILLGVGYFFGGLYSTIDSWLGKLSIVGLGILLVFLFMGYTSYVKKKI